MAGSENDKKMELLHRAVGQVEGVAFFQSEVVRDLLMAAVEDITDGVEAMQSQIMAAEEDRLLATTKISRLMKDKDDLLTENGKLRAAVETCGLDTPPALRATSAPSLSLCDISPAGGITPIVGEAGGRIATSASPPRNDKDGEAGEMKQACIVCEGQGVIQPIKPENDGFAVIETESKSLIVKVRGEKRLDLNIKFCPVCGRKL